METRFVDMAGARSIADGIAVVIDVMRAYTVAAWALHRGADRIVLVDDLEQAVSLASRPPRSLLFKDGAPDSRFDLHNSPKQLLDLEVSGRRIVQRTTAGTRAAVAAAGADILFCASFVCATATAEAVRALDPDHITFVISGGLGAEEDRACAEFIAAIMTAQSPDPTTYVARAERSAAALDLMRGVELGYEGVTEDDVAMCLEVDCFDFAMRADRIAGLLELQVSRPTA